MLCHLNISLFIGAIYSVDLASTRGPSACISFCMQAFERGELQNLKKNPGLKTKAHIDSRALENLDICVCGKMFRCVESKPSFATEEALESGWPCAEPLSYYG